MPPTLHSNRYARRLEKRSDLLILELPSFKLTRISRQRLLASWNQESPASIKTASQFATVCSIAIWMPP
jgi:hypothetical protein